MTRHLASAFAIDLRSLAAFRIGLGLLVLADLLLRGWFLEDHYSDAGLLPRSALLAVGRPWHLSLHMMSGQPTVQATLFVAAGLGALAMMLGYRTRVATLIVWALTVSLQNRNPMLLQGGDDMLRLLLFWAMFVPLDGCWSLDRRRGSSPAALDPRHLSIGSAALLLQVCIVYWSTALLKSSPVWTTEHSALYYALNIDQFVTPFGVWLRETTWLLPILSWGVIVWEMWGPFLALVPPALGWLRTAAVVGFIAMHGGIALSMELGPFPYICMVAWLPFVPAWAWDKLRVSWRAVARAVPVAHLPSRRLGSVVAGLCLVYVIAWNVRASGKERLMSVFPPSVNPVGEVLRLDQYWNMFAPAPMADDGWYVIPARFEDGSTADLFAGGAPISWAKPSSVATTFASERWRKYLMNLREERAVPHRLQYGLYLCRQWNASRPEGRRLAGFDIVYMQETTLPTHIEKPERVTLWKHRCFEGTEEGFEPPRVADAH